MLLTSSELTSLKNNLPFELPTSLEVLDCSKITTFLDCPRQFFYRHILGWEQNIPSNHLVFGQAWHEAMEHMLHHGYSEPSVLSAFEKFLSTYRETFPESTDELFKPKTPANALKALLAYSLRYASDRFTALHTEIAGQISISHDRYLTFRMDSICQKENSNNIFSLEHKTKGGSFTRTWSDQWALSLQVGTYAHVLNCLFPECKSSCVTINGVAFSAKTTDFLRINVTRSRSSLENWLFTINHCFDRIAEELNQLNLETSSSTFDSIMTSFPMNPNNCTKFFGCPYFDYCSSWANPLEHCSEPPIGFTVNHWNPLTLPTTTHFNL